MMTKTLIAYIPAIHKGYIDFFKRGYKNLFILDLSIVREVPRLERDIRAVPSVEAKKMIEALGIFDKVEILTKENLDLVKNIKDIEMPDEDVSRQFASNYLKAKKIEFISVFLRWDGHNANKKDAEPKADRNISYEDLDKEMMKLAYEQSEKSSDWWRQIGAILTKDNKVISTAFNRPLPSDQVHNIFGDPRSNFDYGVSFELSKFIHAEARIIAEAAKNGISLDGTKIYVTTFPCPVCAKSIALSGIKTVYYKEGYSLLDAEDILKKYDIDIVQVGNSD